MPVSLSAAKRQRQNKTRRIHNRAIRSNVRTSIKDFELSVEKKDKSVAEVNYRTMVKLIDTAAGKGIFSKNMAARKKSRMCVKLNRMEG